MAKSELNWINIDIATLTTDQRTAYDAYKEAYVDMKDARDAFETLAAKTVKAPAGKRVVFGYMFGKLSVALANESEKAKAKAKPAGSSLADLR